MICDLVEPTCSKCAKTGRSCDYGKVRLRWTDCVASRGRLAGKKIPLNRPLPLQKNNDHYMMYFESELLPRFNLSNTVPHLDLTSLSKDPILLQSVVAVSNAHLTYRSANSQSLALAKIQDRNNALRTFRKHLMGVQSEEISKSLFIANVLLCILDGIIEPSTESSATHHHLVGGKAILKQWGGERNIFQLKGETPVLMLSIFATMDLTHALLMGDEPYFEPSAWAEFGDCEPWWGNVKSNDDFLETMAILAQLATLGHRAHHFNQTIPIGTLLSIQMALEQQARRQEESGHENPERAAWSAFCACYRYASSIYLYRALSSLDVDHGLVQQAVAGCVDVISGKDLTKNLHHCILFPLLIVGSHCMLEEQRTEIRRSLAQTANYLSFESLRSLNGFLDKVWEKMGKNPGFFTADWWKNFDEIASVTCLF